MAVSAAPPKKQVSEEKIQEVINKGGKPTAMGQEPAGEKIKGITIKLMESELLKIKEIRQKRPTRGKKISISLHDWIIEAIQEKVMREDI